jgi:hypothetical protein
MVILLFHETAQRIGRMPPGSAVGLLATGSWDLGLVRYAANGLRALKRRNFLEYDRVFVSDHSIINKERKS